MWWRLACSRADIAAAAAVVNTLTMPLPFAALEPGVSNPSMQQFYLTLEALALGERSSGWDDGVHDTSRPQSEEQKEFAAAELAALAAALGTARSAGTGPAAKGRAPAGAAAAGKHARAADPDADAADAGIDWEAELATGRIEKHTMDELKAFLRAHHLPVSGKKAELVDRVQAELVKIQGTPAAAAAAAPAPARAAAVVGTSRRTAYVVDDDDE